MSDFLKPPLLKMDIIYERSLSWTWICVLDIIVIADLVEYYGSCEVSNRWIQNQINLPSKVNTVDITIYICILLAPYFTYQSYKWYNPNFLDRMVYRSRTIISRSWLEAALEYKQYIRTEFSEKPSLKTKKWSLEMG